MDKTAQNKQFIMPQFPAPNSQQRSSLSSPTSSIGRNKVSLKRGRSLMDWIRLGRSGKDLTGVGGKVLEVTEEELAKHKLEEDVWMAIRGRLAYFFFSFKIE